MKPKPPSAAPHLVLKLEEHPPEQQVYQAFGRAANWLYKFFGIDEVKRSVFRQAFIDVIKEAEPLRFTLDEPTQPQGPIFFDGSQGAHQPYLDATTSKLEISRIRFPRNVGLWIYTGERVQVHVFVSNDPGEQRCIYPEYKLVERVR